MASRARKAARRPLPAAIAMASPPRASTTRPGVQYAHSHSAARPRLAAALPENDVSLSRKAIAPTSSSVLRKKSHSGYATTAEARAKARATGPRAGRRARATARLFRQPDGQEQGHRGEGGEERVREHHAVVGQREGAGDVEECGQVGQAAIAGEPKGQAVAGDEGDETDGDGQEPSGPQGVIGVRSEAGQQVHAQAAARQQRYAQAAPLLDPVRP